MRVFEGESIWGREKGECKGPEVGMLLMYVAKSQGL